MQRNLTVLLEWSEKFATYPRILQCSWNNNKIDDTQGKLHVYM